MDMCKSESVSHIRHFLDFVETHFHTKVQFIRFDNAKELSEGSILQLYHDRGIIHQKSCVATPQQNGVLERKHKHLLETARALYFQSLVPLQFWGDRVLTACYLLTVCHFRLSISFLHLRNYMVMPLIMIISALLGV